MYRIIKIHCFFPLMKDHPSTKATFFGILDGLCRGGHCTTDSSISRLGGNNSIFPDSIGYRGSDGPFIILFIMQVKIVPKSHNLIGSYGHIVCRSFKVLDNYTPIIPPFINYQFAINSVFSSASQSRATYVKGLHQCISKA